MSAHEVSAASADPHPRVAIVLVDYRNLADTVACIESLRQLAYPNAEVIVVDNASPERDDLALRERFGGAVTVIRSATNGGFGAGANQGIRAALARGAELVWLLNNDTLVPPDTLGILAATLQHSPGFGLLSPVISGSESTGWSEEIWFAGGAVDLRRGIATNLVAPPTTDRVFETQFISGCALLVRRAVLETVGLLEDSYFLFWEDVEFCLRARAAGWKCGVEPAARISHRVHGTVGERSYEELEIRNSRDVSGRHGSAVDVAGITLRSWLGLAQAVAGIVVNADRPGSRRRLRGHVLGLGRLSVAVARRVARRPAAFPASRPISSSPTQVADR